MWMPYKQAASDRAERTVLRQKRMEEAMGSTAIAESFTKDFATGEDTDSRYSNQETQTTEVSYKSKLSRPIVLNFVILVYRLIKVIFDERNFLVDDAKVHYYTGFTNCDLLISTFEFVMKKLSDGEKRSYCWCSFIIVLVEA